METAGEYSENIACEGATASDCDLKYLVTLAESLKKSKSSKKKRLSKSPTMPDIYESFKKRRYPLRNLQANVILKSEEPSVIPKSGEHYVISKSDKPSVKPKSGDQPVKSKSGKPPVKSKSGKPPVKLKSREPDMKSTIEEQTVKSKSDKPPVKSKSDKPPVKLKSREPDMKSTVEESLSLQTVKSKSEKPPVKSKSGKPPVKSKSDKPPVKSKSQESPVKFKSEESPVKFKSEESPVKFKTEESPVKFKTEESPVKFKTEESPVKLRSGNQFMTPHEGKLFDKVTEKLSFVYKQDLKSELEGLPPVVTIEQFFVTRRNFLYELFRGFMEAYLFNASADERLRINNVFTKRTDTAGNEMDWKLFHRYWDKFKQDFRIVGMKFINCYPMSCIPISIRKLQKRAQIEPNNIWMRNKVRSRGKVHFPRTKDEFDIFLKSLADIYDIVNYILGVYHCYFDGFLIYCIETDENLFHRYISKIHSYLSPLYKKLRNEIKEIKLFEEKVLNKQ